MAKNKLTAAGNRLATAAKNRAIDVKAQAVAKGRGALGSVGKLTTSPVRAGKEAINRGTAAAEGAMNRAAFALEGTRGSTGPRRRGGARGKTAAKKAAPAVDTKAPVAAPKKSVTPVKKSVVRPTSKPVASAASTAPAVSAREARRASIMTNAENQTIAVVGPSAGGSQLNAAVEQYKASGGKASKKNVQIGGLIGRKDGKWYLGRQKGRG